MDNQIEPPRRPHSYDYIINTLNLLATSFNAHGAQWEQEAFACRAAAWIIEHGAAVCPNCHGHDTAEARAAFQEGWRSTPEGWRLVGPQETRCHLCNGTGGVFASGIGHDAVRWDAPAGAIATNSSTGHALPDGSAKGDQHG